MKRMMVRSFLFCLACPLLHLAPTKSQRLSPGPSQLSEMGLYHLSGPPSIAQRNAVRPYLSWLFTTAFASKRTSIALSRPFADCIIYWTDHPRLIVHMEFRARPRYILAAKWYDSLHNILIQNLAKLGGAYESRSTDLARVVCVLAIINNTIHNC